jgi:glycosyltransferase involved in cell wall biosynthesis
LRVAHLLKTTGLSGAESHLLALSGGLRAEGFESRLIVLADQRRPPTALIEAARAANVQLDTVPLAGDLDVAVAPKIAALLKPARTQIVHTHMIHGDLYGALAARMAGIAVVQSRHNDDKFRRRWPVRLLTRWLAAQAKTVIAISDSLAAFVREVEGVPGSKIVRIHYGLDPAQVTAQARPGKLRAELGLNDDVPLVGAVGRLTEQKGFRYLLEAFAIVRRSLPQAQLVIAGDGELRSTLEAQKGHNIHLLGWRSDAPSIMADLDVLAVPSLWEGFGLVTLEAMALSKPVVASRVSALPEIVADGETGLLVPPADPKALAGALCALLTDKARARAMGERGRARLQLDFSVQRMARQHVAVYKEAASRVPEFRA